MKNAAETLHVTLIQSDLSWENKTANLDMFERKILAVQEKMELVVLPEMFNTGFSMNPEQLWEDMEGPTIQWMKRVSRENKIVLTGSIIVKENGQYYNRMIWMLPNGNMGIYDKRHLFAFAGEDEKYNAGRKRLIASLKGWKLNLQVCYDLRFPVWARQSVPIRLLPDGSFEKGDDETNTPEYDVLVYVANWPEKRSHAWKTLLKARAIENQCYVIGVNRVGIDGNGHHYTGDSMIVGPLGDELITVAHDEAVIHYLLSFDSLRSTREKFQFLRDADPFIIGN